MIGDKRLDMPETLNDAIDIIDSFGMENGRVNIVLHNARRLVEINNEVYDRLHMRPMKYQAKRGEPEFLNER
ncbi:MAG: hypothetical protein PHQ35_09730 [Phycisphaerae bacterium]|nr:hypothetical protein [Phycisphaerae bacterium]MDD5239991.1 hypothetical protein [Candidatus Nanoarchaeia archaeon]